MTMHNPPHPGSILREDVLPALGLTITQAADELGISRTTLSRVLHEHERVTPEMALRIEHWLGVENGGSAEVWSEMQLRHDLWNARQRLRHFFEGQPESNPKAPRRHIMADA